MRSHHHHGHDIQTFDQEMIEGWCCFLFQDEVHVQESELKDVKSGCGWRLKLELEDEHHYEMIILRSKSWIMRCHDHQSHDLQTLELTWWKMDLLPPTQSWKHVWEVRVGSGEVRQRLMVEVGVGWSASRWDDHHQTKMLEEVKSSSSRYVFQTFEEDLMKDGSASSNSEMVSGFRSQSWRRMVWVLELDDEIILELELILLLLILISQGSRWLSFMMVPSPC